MSYLTCSFKENAELLELVVAPTQSDYIPDICLNMTLNIFTYMINILFIHSFILHVPLRNRACSVALNFARVL